MFVSRKVKSLKEMLRNVVHKFKCRLGSSENEHIMGTLYRHISTVNPVHFTTPSQIMESQPLTV